MVWYAHFIFTVLLSSNYRLMHYIINFGNHHIAGKFSSHNVWQKWMDKNLGEKVWQMNRPTKGY